MHKQVSILRTRNKQIKRVVAYYKEFVVIQFKDETFSIIKSATGWEGEDELNLDYIFNINSDIYHNLMMDSVLKKMKIISKKEIEIANKKRELEETKQRYARYLELKKEFESEVKV